MSVENKVRLRPAPLSKFLFSRRGTRLLRDKWMQIYPGAEDDVRSLGPSAFTPFRDPSPDCLWPQQKSIGCSTEKTTPPTSMAGAFCSVSTMNQCVMTRVSRWCVWQGRCSRFAYSPEYKRVSLRLCIPILSTLDSLEMRCLLENTPCYKQVDERSRKWACFPHLPLPIFSC